MSNKPDKRKSVKLKGKCKKNVFLPSTIVCSLYFLTNLSAYASSDYAEFNPVFLRGNGAKETIDVKRFSYGNPIPEGEYLSDIYLNGQFKGRINLRFMQIEADKSASLCADRALISVLDLVDSAVNFTDTAKNCQSFKQVFPAADMAFNLSNFRLDVGIPQALIRNRPEGYIPAAQWQEGVPAAFLRYDTSYYNYQYPGTKVQQGYLGIDSGVNIAGWALRHRGSQSWQQQKRLPYESIETYAQREVAPLRAQFTIGDFYTNGQLLESFGVRGIQLASDDRMLPSSVRGYAPVIQGVANSNARVSVRQNGNLLREISIPAGPFVINDLYPTGYGGDLEVEILEADGEKRSFRVPYTATAQLIRKGYGRYQFTAGQYRYGSELFKDKVMQGTWQYGLTNNLTLNAGGVFNKNYHAQLLGFAFNTPIGAFATNLTRTNATFINGNQKRKGYSFYGSYNTRIEPTQTNVTLAAYRYFSKNYYSLQDVLRANQSNAVNANAVDLGIYSNRLKQQFNLSISQALPDKWGYFYLTGSTGRYWDENKERYKEYQLGYSNQYKKLTYGLSFSKSRSSSGRNENRLYASFSLPLGSGSNVPTLSQAINMYRYQPTGSQTMVSGTLGKQRQYAYTLAATRQNETTNVSVSNSYYGSLARLNGSWSRDSQHNKQWSLGISGAAVLHPKGLTLSNDLGDTFAIIHADGAAGAEINNTTGNKLDYFGNGIVPYVEPYSINYVGINGDSLPNTVELSATEQQIIPKANSAILVNFASTVGEVVFFELQPSEGQTLPPIGADVFDDKNNNVGMVAQGGKIYTRGVADKGKLHIHWSDKQCIIDYRLPERSDNGQLPLIVPVRCQK